MGIKNRTSGSSRWKKWQRHLAHQQCHHEQLRIFGYIELRNGETISYSEARIRNIDKQDILIHHPPELERDAVETCIGEDGRIEHHSIGEMYVVNDYPNLNINAGDVLFDVKRLYHHPRLATL